MSPRLLAIVLLALLLLTVGLSLCVGTSDRLSASDALRGALATVGLAEPLEAYQGIARLRTLRVVLAVGVGAALALSGALLQGVFRNDLASPGIIGISSGASLGAALAILVIGGYGPDFLTQAPSGVARILVTACAFLGAMGIAWLVTAIASTRGRISVPTLLLAGIAINAVVGGTLSAIQHFALGDQNVAQALFGWLFGRLEDREPFQIGVVWIGVVGAASVIPFVARELDLFAGGEDDARALGVDTHRAKVLALVAASFAAAVAVSVAGQIAFIGLVVPHVLRRLGGARHGMLLPMCLLGGPVLLLGADLLQRPILGKDILPPGVAMSLVGGVFFLFLLVRNRGRLEAW